MFWDGAYRRSAAVAAHSQVDTSGRPPDVVLSSFDGAQPPHIPKYDEQVRSAKTCEQQSAPSLDHRWQAARRTAHMVL
ncbi:hypothetical protein TRAPUB_9674 [Trametes pubescens]|uniref:Uncharacterized protein n=1 Tax=Trametes pubescens TaxID=154538 RepID=A0A1M2W1P0_TRAPU|nr:hypothetical protein TRAPUB_9674 [Trametes pubescens]